MNVLFFTYDFPYPTDSGGKMRAYNLMKYAQSGMHISLFSFVRPGFDEKHINHISSLGVKNIRTFPRQRLISARNLRTFVTGSSIFKTLYYDPEVAEALKSYVEEASIDVLHCESFYTSFYLGETFPSRVKKIYGSENIEHRLYEEYVRYNVPSVMKPFYTFQVQRVKREEIEAVRRSDVTLAVTESEKEYFASVGGKKTEVIENGVAVSDFSFKQRKPSETVAILFVGNFSYFPNKEAVDFFVTHVLRRISNEQIAFTVIGKGAVQFRSFHDPRIQTHEYVKDITKAYYDADIFVSPVKIGGGTNFKILEAMATGVPVVTFSARVKDIGAVDGTDVLTGDTPEMFREQVVRLIEDPELRGRLARNARKIIEEKFSWDTIGKNLNRVWRSLDEKH